MSLSKTCMDPNVSVGDTVRFVLNITNTGNWNITNPYIKEKSFDGLTYIGYTDDTGLWSYQDNYSWNYNGNLTEGQTAGLTVMFKVTKQVISLILLLQGIMKLLRLNIMF